MRQRRPALFRMMYGDECWPERRARACLKQTPCLKEMMESLRLQTFREQERKSSGLGKLGSIKGIQPGHPIRFCAPEQEGGQLSVQPGRKAKEMTMTVYRAEIIWDQRRVQGTSH